MKRPLCASASIALHAAFLIQVSSGAQEPAEKAAPKVAYGTIRPLVFRPLDEAGTGLACAHQYDGVGFEHTWDGRVISVARGGPAWRYGVRIGHQMLTHERGDGWIEFTFEVSGAVVTRRIPTGDICQDES